MTLLGTSYQTIQSFSDIPVQTIFTISIYNEMNTSSLTVELESGEPVQIKIQDIENHCREITDYMNAIYFYSPHEAYGVFSNFSSHGIEVNDKYYPTVEHYYQSQKFLDESYQEKIRLCTTPKEASVLGQNRSIAFDQNWETNKIKVMKIALEQKFLTHQEVKEQLLFTEDKLLIENSPYDRYWGIGRSGDGKNYLGVLLMQLRNQLSEETK